MEDTVSVHQSH